MFDQWYDGNSHPSYWQKNSQLWNLEFKDTSVMTVIVYIFIPVWQIVDQKETTRNVNIKSISTVGPILLFSGDLKTTLSKKSPLHPKQRLLNCWYLGMLSDLLWARVSNFYFSAPFIPSSWSIWITCCKTKTVLSWIFQCSPWSKGQLSMVHSEQTGAHINSLR